MRNTYSTFFIKQFDEGTCNLFHLLAMCMLGRESNFFAELKKKFHHIKKSFSPHRVQEKPPQCIKNKPRGERYPCNRLHSYGGKSAAFTGLTNMKNEYARFSVINDDPISAYVFVERVEFPMKLFTLRRQNTYEEILFSRNRYRVATLISRRNYA